MSNQKHDEDQQRTSPESEPKFINMMVRIPLVEVDGKVGILTRNGDFILKEDVVDSIIGLNAKIVS